MTQSGAREGCVGRRRARDLRAYDYDDEDLPVDNLDQQAHKGRIASSPRTRTMVRHSKRDSGEPDVAGCGVSPARC